MKKCLLIIFSFLSYHCWAQGNMITINSIVPAQMTVCGVPKVFTITIYNPSPFLLTNDTLKIAMPAGITYQAGTIAGAVYLFTAAPNRAVFLLPSIPLLTTLNISFSASVGCDVMSFISGGGIIENNIRVDYTANGAANYDSQITAAYIIRQPSLSITTVTNQSYTGNIGDVFTRCITIINGGFGELSQFTLTDIHGLGVQITAVNKGTWTSAGGTETIVLNGVDFAGVGNGNNLFENGESITICETVQVLNCISVASAFEAYWGCNSQHCQSSVSNANVVFPNLIPKLEFSPNNGSVYFQMNSCVTQASPQQLRVVNTGLGQAVNVQLDIFQATGVGYNPYVGSNIDPGSFTTQVGISSTPVSIVPTGTETTSALSCMSPASIGRAYLTIPFINPGDTVYIKWNTYSCCWDGCAGTGQYYINGWRYKGTYDNICQNNYVIAETWGKVYSYVYGDFVNNSSPATMTNGQTGTFDFLFSDYNFWYPIGTGAHWKIEFTLPPCLTYSGNLEILRSNGVDTWIPSTVTTSGNVVTAIFNGTAPWDLNQSEVKIDLTVDCSACGGSYSGAVSIKSSYIPDTSCGCEVEVSCQSAAVNFLCPGSCPEGMIPTYFEMKRTSYGLPDNEAGGGNGIPDGSGSLDFTKIRTDRSMFGDTITASFNGKVKTSIAHPSWQYCFANSSISNGNLLSFLDSKLYVYRGGSLIAICNNIAPVVSTITTTRNFFYDLSTPALISGGCLPVGFIYLNNDSVVFKPRYKVTVNIGWTTVNCNIGNEYYLSDIANPVLPANKFQCSTYNGNCTILGYGYYSSGSDNYIVKSCDNAAIYQNYYCWIGPAWQEYRNSFPNEYRNWAHIKTLTSIVPAGYTFISARFINYRTAGTNVYNASPWIVITPVNPNSDTLSFPVEKYFEGYGGTDPPPAGTIPLSDDGFAGTLEVVIEPSCKVTPTVSQPIENDWTFSAVPNITGTGSYQTFISVIQDSIIYQAPILYMQSALPSILVPDSTASWDVCISNSSNISDALNTWLSGPSISGVSIIKLVDLGTNLPIVPIGSIYQVGTVNASGTRCFRITGSFTSCAQDSIVIYTGWNCNAGYPSSVQTYPCTPKTILLKVTPLMPFPVLNVTAPSNTVQLCDTASYTIEGVNVQLGTAYNVVLPAILPIGVMIVSGSSQFRYPVSNPYSAIPDPVFMGGTTWKWDISAINSIIHANGLKGILKPDSNSFKLTFKVITSCGYTSGSTISFSLKGVAACGQATGHEVLLSSALGITNATPPYHTEIKLITTYISPCANTSTMKVVIKNNGPVAFNNADSVVVLLPPGVSFVNSSFAGLYNPPGNGVPTQFTLNGKIHLTWKLPPLTAVGDSTVFSFGYKGDPMLLSCEITQFEAITTSSTNVICIQSGTNCGINIVTGDTTLSVFTYKAYLSLSNGSAVSIPNPPGGETVTVNLDITNTGQAISSGANSIIKFYYDADGNGIYSAGDVFLTQNAIAITNNSVMPYAASFNVLAGQACSIIAIIDTAVNPCVCNPSQLLVHPLLNGLRDSTLCSGQTMTLNFPPVTGYNYSWTPAAALSSIVISNPLFTALNLTTAPAAVNYILTTNRMGCISKDTVKITVNPIPVSNAGADIVTCPANTPGNIGVAATAGYTYIWSPALYLSDIAVSNPAVTLTNPGTTTYILTTTALGCFSSDSVVVKVNPIPISNAGADIITCTTNTLGNIGAASNPSYAYHWSPAIYLSDTAISNPAVTLANPGTTTYIVSTSALGCTSADTVIVKVNPFPVSNAGADILTCSTSVLGNIGTASVSGYSYLWSPASGLSDAAISNPAVTLSNPGTTIYTVTTSALGCVSIDSAVVRVNPMPTGVVSGTIAVCEGAAAQNIIFTGAAGTAPYTFTYSFNAGPNQTISTSVGNSVSISVPASTSGTFTYALVSVQDASSTACTQVQNGSAIITVNPLPMAAIAGTAAVCKNDPAPIITFTGTAGTAPYTFTYKINGGANQTITSIGNSITLTASSAIAGTFIYSLGSVQDASSTACIQTQTGRDTITINPLPIANFGFEDVCLHQSIHFNDSTTISGGTISGWLWDFGDGPPQSTASSPSDIYANPGTYTVSLKVITSSGCKDTAVKNVVVHPLPNAQFYTLPASIGICDGTAIQFHDTSTIAAPDIIQSWKWNFGDASLININQNTSHLYAAPNAYTVHLAVVSNFGCSDSTTHVITINPNPAVNFSVDDSAGCMPLCVNFTDLSTIASGVGSVHWLWDFGDGTHGIEPVHCYTNDSLYFPVVTLTVTSDSGCAIAKIKHNLITIYPNPHADFSAAPEITTVIDPVISFINLSTGADFWNWNFGDFTSASDTTPHPHTYAADTAKYLITLITSTLHGCRDTAYQSIIIDADFVFYIPNSFTPNEDGINDYFFGKGIGIVKYDFSIFDRWGNLIFDCNINGLPQSPSCQWDGRANHGEDPAQIDVYVWKVKLTDVFGKVHNYIGTVTLVK